MAKDFIQPESFYSSEIEKIKLNWFLYEIALSFHTALRKKLRTKYRKYSITNKDLASFSIFAAKQMKKVVHRLQTGELRISQISYTMVESYFPSISANLIDKTLVILDEAFDELLLHCKTCPTSCLSDKTGYCTMFDEGPY